MTSEGLRYDAQAAIRHLKAVDARLAAVIDGAGPFELEPRGDPYQSLFRAVLYQQLAGAAAAAIERRVLAIFGGSTPRPEEMVATPDEALRSAGLSRQKTAYLKDLAAKVLDGSIRPDLADLPDDEVVREVTSVKGIGRWTAEMLLIFCLGRPDVLPTGDLGLRKAIQKIYGLGALPSPAEVERIAEPWRPYRSVATWYLWRASETVLPGGGATVQ